MTISKEVSSPAKDNWSDLLSPSQSLNITVCVLNHGIQLVDSSSWEDILKAGDNLSRYLEDLSSPEVAHAR